MTYMKLISVLLLVLPSQANRLVFKDLTKESNAASSVNYADLSPCFSKSCDLMVKGKLYTYEMEFSPRKDYHVSEGKMKINVAPNGAVMTQSYYCAALKIVKGDDDCDPCTLNKGGVYRVVKHFWFNYTLPKVTMTVANSGRDNDGHIVWSIVYDLKIAGH